MANVVRRCVDAPAGRSRVLLGTVVGLLLVGMLPATAAPPSHAQGPTKDVVIRTVSSEPDMVTGGDALVEIALPRTVRFKDVRVALDGEDITEAFYARDEDRMLLGVVEDLEHGDNSLEVSTVKGKAEPQGEAKGQPSASLTLTNHPVTGPVISGPHQQPFVCKLDEWGLKPLDDGFCAAETEVEYWYRSTDGEFAPLEDSDERPDDLSEVTTSTGETAPYIVRVERGTINRAVYEVAVLHDPQDDELAPWMANPGWNERLVYTFGGGCRSGYHQGLGTGGVMSDLHLSQGYAVASSTLNVNNNGGCNDVVSAETLMMVKERVVEQLGEPMHTIGWGASGGAMQQHLIAQNYPGLLDGITPTLSYPDATTYFMHAEDCRGVLQPVLDGMDELTDEQKRAVTGYAQWSTCDEEHIGRPGRLDPTDCDDEIPEELRYDPENNPEGARCSIYDSMINIFGVDEETGFAPRPNDNVGVQYGLGALNDGTITMEQFLEINEAAGGYDIDMNPTAERVEGDVEAIRTAYRTGRITTGAGGLATTPIIDARPWLDHIGNFHDAVQSFSLRQRLIDANGSAENQVILQAHPDALEGTSFYSRGELEPYMLEQMDAWLTAIGEDTSDASEREKMLRAKPDDLVDACQTHDGTRYQGDDVWDEDGDCYEALPPSSLPRVVAGGPLAHDVWKCALKEIDEGDYAEALTDADHDRLEEIFPDGVCDWTQPSMGYEPLEGTWLSYGSSLP